MSIDILPTEILQKILTSLDGATFLSYSSVCRRWQLAINGLSENFWKELCGNRYGIVHEDAHRKASISWRELFRSLSLWSKVSDATITLTQIPATDTNNMFILQNRIVSCCHRSRDECPEQKYDTILYFDLDTRVVTHRVDIDVFFTHYAESDKIIVVEYAGEVDEPSKLPDRLLRMISKADDRIYTVNIINSSSWILYENEVFYSVPNREEEGKMQLLRVKLVENGNNVTLEEEVLCRDLGGNLEQVSCVSGELLLFLMNDDMRSIYIYRLIGTELELMYELSYNGFRVGTYNLVKKSGFKCASDDWLSYHSDKSDSNVLFCIYGEYVIIRSDEAGLHIFSVPYDPDSHFEMHKRTPDLSIDLKKCLWDCKHTHIEKIEIVESVNGHIIVILVDKKLFMFELDHGESSKRAFDLSPTTPKDCSLRKRKRRTVVSDI